MTRAELKSTAELVLQFSPSQECTAIAEHVLADLAATADGAEPLTVERCVAMGGRPFANTPEMVLFETDTGNMIVDLDGRWILTDYSGDSVYLPGTYRTVGSLRRLLAGLKGEET